MATLPVLRPNGQVSAGVWTSNSGSNTNLHLLVDEGIAGAVDAGDYIQGPDGTSNTVGESARLNLTDMPADFLSMNSLSIQVRYAQTGRADDTVGLEAVIYKAGETAPATPLATGSGGFNFQPVVAAITNTAFQNSSVIAFVSVDTAATKADWDGAVLHLRQTYSSSMSNDGARALISAVELTGTYTASIAPPAAITDLSATPANGQVALSWTAPADNGSAITGYEERHVEQGSSTPELVIASGGTVGPQDRLSFQSFTTIHDVVHSLYFPAIASGTIVEIRDTRTGTALGKATTNVSGAQTVTFASPIATPVGVTRWVYVGHPGIGGYPNIAVRNDNPYPGGTYWNGDIEDVSSDMCVTVNPGGVGPQYTAWAATGSTASDHIVTGLTNGTAYDFQVRAVNAGGPAPESNTATATPAAPSGPPTETPTLTTGPITHNSIDMLAGSVAGAITYEFQRDAVTVQNTSSQTLNDSGLAAETSYTYRVRGVNAQGAGPWSTDAVATTTAAPVAPTQTPSLTVGTVTETTISVSAGGFVEDGSFDTIEFQRDLVTVQNTVSATLNDTGLTTATTYSYRARLVNEVGGGPWSTAVQGTTLSGPQFAAPSADGGVSGAWTYVPSAPGWDKINDAPPTDASYVMSPSNPDATVYHGFKLSSLDDPASSTGHVLRYRISKEADAGREVAMTIRLYNSDPQAGGTEVANWFHTGLGSAWVQYDQALTPAQADLITDYTNIYVRFDPTSSGGGAGRSARLSWIQLEVPSPPPITTAPTLTVGTVTQTSVALTASVVTGAANFEFQRDGFTAQNSTLRTFTDTGRVPGATHTYRVRATNSSGAGPWSDPQPVTLTAKTASGGSAATLNVTTAGAGSKRGTGGSTDITEVVTSGAGLRRLSGGSTAVVEVVAAGDGLQRRSGGSTAIIEVTALGAGVVLSALTDSTYRTRVGGQIKNARVRSRVGGVLVNTNPKGRG